MSKLLRTTRPPPRCLAVPTLERIAHQPQQRRPKAHEQRSAFRVSALALVMCLGPDPQDDAEEHGGQRGEVQVPTSQTGPVHQINQHRRLIAGACAS